MITPLPHWRANLSLSSPDGRSRTSASRSNGQATSCRIIALCSNASRTNQLRFNGALLARRAVHRRAGNLHGAKLADRLVRPVGQLVAAAGRIEEGDFTARVPVDRTPRTKSRPLPPPSTG